ATDSRARASARRWLVSRARICASSNVSRSTGPSCAAAREANPHAVNTSRTSRRRSGTDVLLACLAEAARRRRRARETGDEYVFKRGLHRADLCVGERRRTQCGPEPFLARRRVVIQCDVNALAEYLRVVDAWQRTKRLGGRCSVREDLEHPARYELTQPRRFVGGEHTSFVHERHT